MFGFGLDNLLNTVLIYSVNPLKTSPEVYLGWGLWEMYVIAKSNNLQRVNRNLILVYNVKGQYTP